jgi:cobalt-zinc-cadmium efflux system membrane fusion protein
VFEARLTHLGKTIDPDTRTVLCVASLNSEDRGYFVNKLFVEASIVTCERESFGIPDQAVIREEGKFYILLYAEERKDTLVFHKTLVQPGVIQQGYAEILDPGLKGILLKGVYNLILPGGNEE